MDDAPLTLVERLRAADMNSLQRVNGSRIFKEAADEIERLRAALAEIITNDRWNNKSYTGNDVWNYGACAKIAQAALRDEQCEGR